MENKKFNFVLVQYGQDNVDLAQEVNQAAMEKFGCDGIEEFSLEEKRVDEILGERAYSGGDIPESLIDEVQEATNNQESTTFKYFFYQTNFAERALDFFSFIKNDFSQLPIVIGEKDFEDWNSEWKKFYSPIKVSDKLEIIPEWLKDKGPKTEAEKVYIYPGMGFGTGTHETTFLCLSLFEQIRNQLKNGTRCLDFGCGSGILGITALKTLNMACVFCDIDKSALDNCVQNLLLNFEGQNLNGTSLVIRERFQPEKFKLVFANILEHVLLVERKTIVNSLDNDGFLIVSGLLNHQVQNIIDQYQELEKISVVSKNDWSAILFKRKI